MKKKIELSDQVIGHILSCEDRSFPDLSVEQIARFFGVSESFLTRKFKIDKQCTVGEFIFKERMFRAAHFLTTHDNKLTISDLSNKIGFMDSNYFSRIFKKHFGVTPHDFRGFKLNRYSGRTMEKNSSIES
ncbi:MAG: helix-turn-helix transcriptional regulator [bacterium]|nr:helix-turn-helix transcriptional regulator [bacterium]